ncbi:MAG: transcription-repair coupling factor [Bifidobacteriaceae bacterium]|jgi:transcription-repair coupling factor (superfamily II helicase)|nr:transcription-repair coupling factor [Bifidobacteriaceae bacterium]
MTLSHLPQLLARDPGMAEVLERVRARAGLTAHQTDHVDIVAIEPVRPALAASMARAMAEARRATAGRSEGPHPPVVVITASTSAAEALAEAATAMMPGDAIAVLPAWETLPHERLSPRADTLGRRTAVFRRLAHPEPSGRRGPIELLITPLRSVLQPVVNGLGELEPVKLMPGDQADLTKVAERLAGLAYNRVDMVTRRGEFAVRGGILDVFPPTEDHAVRVDFWGDEVEEIRYFAVLDQRSSDLVEDGLWAPACGELLLTPAVRARARALTGQLPGITDMLDQIAQGIKAEGMESLIPVLADGLTPVLNLAPKGSLMLFLDPERLRRRAEDLLSTAQEFLEAAWEAAAVGADSPVDLAKGSFLTLDQLHEEAVRIGCGWWNASSFGLPGGFEADSASPADGPPEGQRADAGPPGASNPGASNPGAPAADGVSPGPDPGAAHFEAGFESRSDGPAAADGVSPGSEPRAAQPVMAGRQAEDAVRIALGARELDNYHGRVPAAVKQLKDWVKDGWTVALTTEGAGPAKRLVERLGGEGVPARLVADLDQDALEHGGGVVLVTTASGGGFQVTGLKLALVSQKDLTGRSGTSTRDMRRMPSRRKAAVDPLQLNAGDLVVHEQHGVGRFVELVDRTVGSGENAATREYLLIEYAPSKRGQPGDRLYVPTDSLDQVTRYVGGENPALSKLGGSDWAKTKARARQAVSHLAEELIRLYSARMATKGFAFSPDTPWQRELEDAFAYVETPDQLTTIDEVKGDMEQTPPMDRLVCGDVGYGKTEIAVRAAFKAVQDGKQVAVLAPTTLLVRQHMETFTDRYAAFPVEVRALSRFQKPKEARQTKEDLAAGKVDVVIGTHSLVTGDVRFKDLGLVIVDEEQRFGVEHKETLKAQRPEVDVLTMSATPIPRTMEMAVSGIRQMSTLTTPPEERHPVLTYVGPRTPGQIAAAVRRELLREGQVFYVHNRVQSINRVAAALGELIPEARIAIAHGQMREAQLEKVMVDFWEKRFDVLVCTTIVETGLDIANANTLIVDDADKFGLAQLHQLRGRVGRGKERAYAYFFYGQGKTLTETAHDRLSTIAAQSELGAGMRVALKDLEIRGAGNMLGGEQSGHIAGVGFDLYLRMMADAVAGAKGEANEAPAEVQIELPVNAHIPNSYVDGDRLRLEAYTKLSQAASAADLDAVADELTDRYGPIPEPVEALFEVARLRLRARAAGLAQITAQGRFIRLSPCALAESQQLWLQRTQRGTVVKPATRTVLVPIPRAGGRLGDPAMAGVDLVRWLGGLIDDLVKRVPVAVQ